MLMSKITLFVVLLMVFFSGSAQATLWAERCNKYQSQSNSNCAFFESVEEEFNWEKYQDIADNGDVEEVKKLISSYEAMAGEYEFLENEIGSLFYRIMILSLKTVYCDHFESSNFGEDEYVKILQELKEKKEKINNLISPCGYIWE